MVTGDASDFYATAARLDRSADRIGASLAASIRRTGKAIERDARALAPVGHDGYEDGHLRDSISASFEGDGRFGSMSATIEASAPYAGYVEEGTSDTPPQPFMQPAFERNIGDFERAVVDAGGEFL